MSKRIPKTISVPNPDYYTEQRIRLQRENSGYPFEDFYPEEYDKKLPEDGGWIMIIKSVHVGKQTAESVEHIDVPHLSIWFAIPCISRNGLSQAVIQTPQGSVHVYPHEYQKIDVGKFLEFDEQDGFYIHFLSESSKFDEEAMFYLRSRGINKAEAQRMLLADLKDPFYCYFTFHENIGEYFGDGCGTPYFPRRRLNLRASQSTTEAST